MTKNAKNAKFMPAKDSALKVFLSSVDQDNIGSSSYYVIRRANAKAMRVHLQHGLRGRRPGNLFEL